MTIAIVLSMLAFVLMGMWVTIPGLIIGVLLMDLGVQSTQVSQQSKVMALLPEARSRINTLYMVGRFMGGAAGSAISAAAWSQYKWTGVCVISLFFLTIAIAIHAIGQRTTKTIQPSLQKHSR